MRCQLARKAAIALVMLAGIVGPAATQTATCKPEDIPAAVDATGATLRQYTMATQPQLQPRLKALAAKNGWGDEGYEEQAFGHLKDARITKLDETASELLTRIDNLGELKPGESPDCARVEGIKAAGVELLAVMKAKTAYVMGKIDAELGTAPAKSAAAEKSAPEKAVEAPAEKPSEKPSIIAKGEPAEPATPAAKRPPQTDTWSAKTSQQKPAAPAPAPQQAIPPPLPPPTSVPSESTIAMQAPPPAPSPTADRIPRPSEPLRAPPPQLSGEDGYTIEEIRDATRGFFGGVSTGLAQVIEHAFRKSGKPTGYVLGTEGGGAFIGGLRYGKGTLYLRTGGSQEVYWHGPSLGFDFGASGTRTMFLVYKLRDANDIFRVYTGIDGSAFVVGGVGITLLSGGDMILAPIRSGIGMRIGASIGYVRFTPTQTWNPL